VKGNNPGKIQVVVVSPISSLRVGLHTILSSIPEIDIVAEAASLEDPGMLPLADITLFVSLENPSNSLLNALLEENPESTFLFMLNPVPGAGMFHFSNPQPLGLISLNAGPEEIAGALRALHAGLWVVSPEFIGQLTRIGRSTEVSIDSGDGLNERETNDSHFSVFDALTRRETDVLECLARGMTNKEISHSLSISEHTVKYHITSIYSKLGANNRTEAVRQGVIHGLIVI
jgi:DNA-binding NarL/FixJ family response regulator